MNIVINKEKFLKDNYELFLKIYLSEKNKPITHANLEECYTDKAGKRYYRFPKSMAIPVDRFGMQMKFQQYLAKGLSVEEDILIDTVIEDAIENGLKDPKKKSSAIIASALQERKRRRALCFHTELFYNYLAVQWVREDENPFTYDNTIQLEKVEQFKKEAETGNLFFFFRQPELEKLRTLLNLTEDQLQKLTEDSKQEIQLLKERIELIRSYDNI